MVVSLGYSTNQKKGRVTFFSGSMGVYHHALGLDWSEYGAEQGSVAWAHDCHNCYGAATSFQSD
jgi:hypothetical protein